MKQCLLFVLIAFFWLQSPLCAYEHENFVVICCSGKSGSSSLESSFKTLGFPTERFHQLNHDQAEILANKGKTVIMIDAMRDILSRKISSYFQNISDHIGMTAHEIMAKHRDEGIDFVLQGFDKIIVPIEQYYAFNSWKHYGYDCLQDGVFDRKKRYQIAQVDHIYFVNLLFDDIEDWDTIIRSLPIPLDLHKFSLASTNRKEQKWYNTIYDDFLAHFTLSQESFDAVLENNRQVILHFEGKKGIQNFIDKWQPFIRNTKPIIKNPKPPKKNNPFELPPVKLPGQKNNKGPKK